MDNEVGWKNVINLKKHKRNEKRKIKKLEEERWKKLKERCPHIFTPTSIEIMDRTLNIDNLKNKLLSDEWIEHQSSGWIFVKVLKSGNIHIEDSSDQFEYSILPINNRWGDNALFKRGISELT